MIVHILALVVTAATCVNFLTAAQATNAQVQFFIQASGPSDCTNATAECALQYYMQATWWTEVLLRNDTDGFNNPCLSPCSEHATMCREQCAQMAATLRARSGACLCQRVAVDPGVLGLCRNDCAQMNRLCATREFCFRNECPSSVDSSFDRSYSSTGNLKPVCANVER